MIGRPAMLGRYVIEAELGRGSMGVVYRARDPRIDRIVALKTLHPALEHDESARTLAERFLNEGRAAGRLSHRGLVAVYDADIDATTGVAYLAMEHVEGTDLRQLLRDGIPIARAVQILAEVADALDHAHERGVVHRDVKPANVLIDTQGHAHLTDFGIARLGDSALTQDGEFLGTPAYMAPEQVRSRGVSPRTDVYALGVILYEALTGQRPFLGDSMVATATSIAMDEPPLPSRIAPVPAHYDAVILKALSKDPHRRQDTAGELAREMLAAHAIASGAPTESPLPPPATPLPYRNRRAASLVLVGSLAVLVALGLILRSALPEPGTDVADGLAADGSASDASGSPSEATPASAPAARTTAPPPPPPPPAPRGRLAVDLSSPKRGELIVSDGPRELGRVRLGDERRKGQFSGTRTLSLRQGTRDLTFTFVPEQGRTLVTTATIDVPRDGETRLLLDVGAFGRALRVQGR